MSFFRYIPWSFLFAVFFAVVVVVVAYPQTVSRIPFVYEKIRGWKVNLGLDLQGGLHLVYKIDLSQVEPDKQLAATEAVQAVIERRVNALGVGEPVVQLAQSGIEKHIIVELPGVKDIEQAKAIIRETPTLDFREERAIDDPERTEPIKAINEQQKKRAEEILAKAINGDDFAALAKEYTQDPGSKESGGDLGFVKKGTFVPEFDVVLFDEKMADGMIHPQLVESQFGWHIIKKEAQRGEGDEREVSGRHILFRKYTVEMFPDLVYKKTGLSGEHLKSADVVFDREYGSSEPQVSLQFDDEGTKLFADITSRNVGKTVAIYLDDKIISAPNVESAITDGSAVITGKFTIDEAKKLARSLNEGALPVPITLIGQQSVAASLGAGALDAGLLAGKIGLVLIVVYMVLMYRGLGVVAGMSLVVYIATMVTILKLTDHLPQEMVITLTLSGIAGLILSVGMVVDANILIYERIREELQRGRTLVRAIDIGFDRAWPSVRDGNYSTIMTTFILMLVGMGFVQGFAVILALGIFVSLFVAVVWVRIIVRFLARRRFFQEHTWLLSGGVK